LQGTPPRLLELLRSGLLVGRELARMQRLVGIYIGPAWGSHWSNEHGHREPNLVTLGVGWMSTNANRGTSVVLAAPIASEARAGEIHLSPLVRELTEPSGEFGFGEPTDVELKGLPGDASVVVRALAGVILSALGRGSTRRRPSCRGPRETVGNVSAEPNGFSASAFGAAHRASAWISGRRTRCGRAHLRGPKLCLARQGARLCALPPCGTDRERGQHPRAGVDQEHSRVARLTPVVRMG